MSTSTPWMERVVSPGFPKVEPPYLTDVELQVVEVTPVDVNHSSVSSLSLIHPTTAVSSVNPSIWQDSASCQFYSALCPTRSFIGVCVRARR